MPSPAVAGQKIVPFATNKEFEQLPKQADSDTGELWRKVSPKEGASNKVVGFCDLCKAPDNGPNARTITWGDAAKAEESSRYMKCVVALKEDEAQDLTLTNTDDDGKESTQVFHLPSIKEISTEESDRLKAVGNCVLLEFRQNESGEWLLKTSSSANKADKKDSEKKKPQIELGRLTSVAEKVCRRSNPGASNNDIANLMLKTKDNHGYHLLQKAVDAKSPKPQAHQEKNREVDPNDNIDDDVGAGGNPALNPQFILPKKKNLQQAKADYDDALKSRINRCIEVLEKVDKGGKDLDVSAAEFIDELWEIDRLYNLTFTLYGQSEANNRAHYNFCKALNSTLQSCVNGDKKTLTDFQRQLVDAFSASSSTLLVPPQFKWLIETKDIGGIEAPDLWSPDLADLQGWYGRLSEDDKKEIGFSRYHEDPKINALNAALAARFKHGQLCKHGRNAIKRSRGLLFNNRVLGQVPALSGKDAIDRSKWSWKLWRWLDVGTLAKAINEFSLSDEIHHLMENRNALLLKDDNLDRLEDPTLICSFDQGIEAANIKLRQLYGMELSKAHAGENTEYAVYALRPVGHDNEAKPVANIYIHPTDNYNQSEKGEFFRGVSPRRKSATGEEMPALGFINYNFESTQGLNAKNLRTLFHEIGHAVEYSLREPDATTGAARGGFASDMAEVASQLMEFMLLDKDVAKALASTDNVGGLSQEEIRKKLTEENLKANHPVVELAVNKAILEVFSTSKGAAPRFEDVLQRAKKNLEEANYPVDKDIIGDFVADNLIHALSCYNEQNYQYAFGQMIAAQIKKDVVDADPQHAGARLKAWFNSDISEGLDALHKLVDPIYSPEAFAAQFSAIKP